MAVETPKLWPPETVPTDLKNSERLRQTSRRLKKSVQTFERTQSSASFLLFLGDLSHFLEAAEPQRRNLDFSPARESSPLNCQSNGVSEHGSWGDMGLTFPSAPTADKTSERNDVLPRPGAGESLTEISATKLVRFSEFEVDLQLGELRRNGIRVELRGQLLEVLRVFLERPGELITLDEFRKRLWPANVNVSFDQSVYTAVKQLREALGDSASRPRYIETRARRGYRFIAPVVPWQSSPAAASSIQREATPDLSRRFGWLRGCLCIPWTWVAFILLVLGAGAWFLLHLD